MNDLEKCAHDLAIAYAQTETLKQCLDPEFDSSNTDETNFFDIYKENYPYFLESLKNE